MSPKVYQTLADLVLVTHVAFVNFVVVGLLLILCGGMLGWRWVRNPWFRYAHLAAIGYVVAEAWFGVVCPLTTLEMHLRERAGETTYEGSFIAHWLHRFLYYDAPVWVFTCGYTLFGLAVIGGWLWVRPRPWRRQAGDGR
jgi:hypothetical protein